MVKACNKINQLFVFCILLTNITLLIFYPNFNSLFASGGGDYPKPQDAELCTSTELINTKMKMINEVLTSNRQDFWDHAECEESHCPTEMFTGKLRKLDIYTLTQYYQAHPNGSCYLESTECQWIDDRNGKSHEYCSGWYLYFVHGNITAFDNPKCYSVYTHGNNLAVCGDLLFDRKYSDTIGACLSRDLFCKPYDPPLPSWEK